jgi:hypothetical protein
MAADDDVGRTDRQNGGDADNGHDRQRFGVGTRYRRKDRQDDYHQGDDPNSVFHGFLHEPPQKKSRKAKKSISAMGLWVEAAMKRFMEGQQQWA